MKRLFSAIALLLVCSYVMSQAVPASTMIEKENRNAVMIVINQPVNITTDALQQKLQRAGLNERVKRGAASYKGVIGVSGVDDKRRSLPEAARGPQVAFAAPGSKRVN